MRLKSETWVKAYLRACASRSVVATLIKRGDADAGVTYVRVNRLDGTSVLYGPALPDPDATPTERALPSFAPVMGAEARPDADVEAYLERQLKYDSDLWIIEVEDRTGNAHLDDGR